MILDIDNISKEDMIFNFMSELQPLVQTKLKRQKIKDMSSIIVVADNLVNFKSSTREGYVSSSFKSKVKDKKEKF